jgi:hypothetical protein
MWEVHEGDNPALCRARQGKDLSWTKYQYETLEEAVDYARKFFWPYTRLMRDYQMIKTMCSPQGFKYNGFDVAKIIYKETQS